ncbi:hypothetical protein [Streptomyces johnsoniae]|uniref:Gram-positive cocci surface proteins LPxTG domain-containing protein n=1 Tax=Streptomyces johnsoniae TaxID=3075532 RepID=A0ABU2S8V9_9ACTN|nr:hypothetical protein [Streptomyces sp. DSM 41886]MDT0445248.1 hypothetical protein [Streptomyces sp. DSM 41886]
MRVWVGFAMAAAAVIALFVPSAVAGDPPTGSHAPHIAEGHGAGSERATTRWPTVSGEAAPPPRQEPRPTAFAARQGGEVLPVLPLGAGLASLGLGLGVLGLRLRRAA